MGEGGLSDSFFRSMTAYSTQPNGQPTRGNHNHHYHRGQHVAGMIKDPSTVTTLGQQAAGGKRTLARLKYILAHGSALSAQDLFDNFIFVVCC